MPSGPVEEAQDEGDPKATALELRPRAAQVAGEAVVVQLVPVCPGERRVRLAAALRQGQDEGPLADDDAILGTVLHLEEQEPLDGGGPRTPSALRDLDPPLLIRRQRVRPREDEPV